MQALAGLGQAALDVVEAAAELEVGGGEGGFGVDVEVTGEVGDGEEEIAELLAQGRAVGRGAGVRARIGSGRPALCCQLDLDLGKLFVHLGEDRSRVRPVEADPRRLLGEPVGRKEGRDGGRDAVEEARVGVLLAGLAALPGVAHVVGARQPFGVLAEDVGMPGDHLVADAGEDIGEMELPRVGGQAGEEDDLKLQVAELAKEGGRVAAVDRGGRLVRLLEQIRAEIGGRLLAVPGAAVGCAQTGHEIEERAQIDVWLDRRAVWVALCYDSGQGCPRWWKNGTKGRRVSDKEMKVTDKRMFTADGELREEYRFLAEAPESPAEPTAPQPAPSPAAEPVDQAAPAPAGPPGMADDDWAGGDGGEAHLELPDTPSALGAPTFYDLVALLAEPVSIYLGDVQLPDGRTAEDLEMARLHIDLLGLLRQRTAGNVTAQEAGFLDDLLYRLRLRYVRKRG